MFSPIQQNPSFSNVSAQFSTDDGWCGTKPPRPTPWPASEASQLSSLLNKVAVNPQPLPPQGVSQLSSPFDQVALNPQPLPPKEGSQWTSMFDKVALNPQPLPTMPGLQNGIIIIGG